MSRNPNRFGGEAQTNKSGLHFEQTTSLNDALMRVTRIFLLSAPPLANYEKTDII